MRGPVRAVRHKLVLAVMFAINATNNTAQYVFSCAPACSITRSWVSLYLYSEYHGFQCDRHISIYVTGKMDVLGKTVLPRQNGFAGRQIRFAWTDQAKCIWNYFRSYLFV